MTHCANCGIALVGDGVLALLVHAVSPPELHPARCVIGTTNGVAYGLDDECGTAVPCTDPDCTGEQGPWWLMT